MAIVFFCGKPGGGKSYSVVEHVVLPALKQNRAIWCNIPLKMDLIRADYPEANITWFDASEWERDPECITQVPMGVVLVVDEAWRLFPSGQKSNTAPIQFRSFLAEHRHRSGPDGWTTEIVLISQNPNQIAGWVKGLIDRTHVCLKLDALGFSDRFRLELFTGVVDPDKAPKRQLVQSFIKQYEAKVYQYYKSQSQGEVHGKERPQGVQTSVWRRPLFWFVIPLITVAGVWGVTYLVGFFRGGAVDPAAQKAAAAMPAKSDAPPLASVPASSPRPPPSSSPQPKTVEPQQLSSRWRVAGLIGAREETVILYDGRFTRTLDRGRDCQEYRYGEVRCVVEGEIVTHFSGARDQAPDFRETVPGWGDVAGSAAAGSQRSAGGAVGRVHPSSVPVSAPGVSSGVPVRQSVQAVGPGRLERPVLGLGSGG